MLLGQTLVPVFNCLVLIRRDIVSLKIFESCRRHGYVDCPEEIVVGM